MKQASRTVIASGRIATPLGPMLAAASPRGLAGLWFLGQKHFPDTSAWPAGEHHPIIERTRAQVAEYFAGRRREFELDLDLAAGTPFQQAVWRALLAIGHAQRRTYRELAVAIGRPRAVRAVGAAVGRNPVGIIVPCHRVLGADGSLTGYAGGLERKAALLALERADPGTVSASGPA